MSGEKASSPCGKFQENIFNKAKCQNCFKSREVHLLSERDLEQVKPIYAGWLCLAPEGTDFDNPMQRSRKWQRRFFILYEDGSLSFALDELPSTLPQGTVSMTLCTDIADAESRTGQRNALCLVSAEQDVFIRGDSRDIINGWSEQLAVYLPTDGQNEKKKRKVEPVACQEPSSAKMSTTDSGFLSLDRDEEDRGQDETLVWMVPGPQGNSSSSFSTDAAPSFAEPTGPKDWSASRNRRLERSSSAERMLGRKATGIEQGGGANDSRKGRSEARSGTREKLQSCGDASRLSAAPPQRRSKSLDRRTSDAIVTPDLLNFKKGWMVKLDEDNQWKKSWFVLNADSLRYYKDSVAEEASDLEGEIDLTKCFSVSEFHVQRNYGFQIHTQTGVFTLSAMTAGIRKNWIQALTKNVHPANGPDVTSLPGHLASSRTPEVLPKPDVTPDSSSSTPRPCGATDKWQKGRYQTFDWAEFRPPPPDSPSSPERRRRKEERRRRYENMLGFSLGGGGGGVEPLRVEEEVEECWRLVEKLMCRPEKMIPLIGETETMACGCRQAVEELTVQLEESERHRLKLEARLGSHQQQLDCHPRPDFCPSESTDLAEEPPSLPQLPSIWLEDSDGNLQELEETLLPSPTLDGGNIELYEAERDTSNQAEVQRLSREVELLNQRNQEMLNQLTEADREIERLKAELTGRYTEAHLLPEVEQQEVEEDLEPSETQVEPLCFEATEAKLRELEARLRRSEEAEEIHRQRAAEAVADVHRLSRELEEERERRRPEPAEEVTEVTARSEIEKQSLTPLSQLKQEERFWSLLLRKLKEPADHSAPPTSSASFLLSAATEALQCCQVLELQAGPEHQGLLGPTTSDASCQTAEVEDLMENEQEALKGDEQEALKGEEHEALKGEEQEALKRDKQEDLMENEKECLKGDKIGDLQEVLQENKWEALQEEHQENLQEDLQENLQEDEPDFSIMEIQLDLKDNDEPDPKVLVSELTDRLQELQEQLSQQQEEFKEELSRVRKEHWEETDKLKATCERGFSSMEEAQLKVVEELQRRHQQEVQRLLLERDRLLEEESTATATAIEAIKNAHRLELQREVQRNQTWSLTDSNRDSHLEYIYRQHSEELESYQRELEVLSQQFSLKCLENGHLVQAVDAERKALCQCQQENQDLRTRNQELSGHLAAEITRLCSLAKQDALPLSQGMDLYEMEITLRVKESEVQCLKQEIESLKDELQSAQKDKRNATKKYKDMYTELSIVRAKAERDADELRENLRLAHRALAQSAP